jgi:O-antigen ligase
MGIQKGILENPNDLAINIVISFPLCVAFLLGSRKMFGKVFWSANLVFMMYAVVATYSRSGLIAFAITGIICFWEFVVKGKRMGLLVGMTVLGVIGLVVVAATPSYTARVKSIFEGNVAGSKDKGSREARKQLILAAGRLTMQHPVFGVGPGSFQAVSGTWQPSHNTYLGLSSETGLPGVILFVLVMGLSLRKTRKLQELPGYKTNEELRFWTSALRAGMAAYIVGAAFASTEYNLFQYFIVGYICALYKIAGRATPPPSEEPVHGWRQMRELRFRTNAKRDFARTR